MVKVSSVRLIAAQIANRDSLTGLILVLQNQITNQALKAMDLFTFRVEMFQVRCDLIASWTFYHLHVIETEEK